MKILKNAAESKVPEIDPKPLPSVFEREPISFIKQTALLIKRSSISIIRNTNSIFYKFITNLCFLLLVTGACLQICNDDSLSSVSDRAGVIYIVLTFFTMTAANSTTSLSTDKALFIREQSNKMYNPGAFYLSKRLFDIPFDQIIVIVSSFLLYLVVGLSLDSASQIFFFVFVILILDFSAMAWETSC